MNRRKFLAGASTGLAALAGCMGGRLNFTDSPRVRWDWQADGFLGEGMEPVIMIRGTVTNVSDTFVDDVRLECTLLDGAGNRIARGKRHLTQLSTGEEQFYYFKFAVSQEEGRAFDDVEMVVWVNGDLVTN